jgi:pimeloyl-ACP methyl ester carboxylesterase
VAVVLPGSASTAEFVVRAFGAPLAAAGFCLVTTDPAPGSEVISDQLLALDDAVRRFAPRLLGGVSLGAHLVARWAAERQPRLSGLLLTMPAWTGEPDIVASLSAITADDVERAGIGPTLDRIRSGVAPDAPGAWVVDELATAWTRYTGAGLAAALRATAASVAPSLATLAGLSTPCGVVALADDPMHPAAVAADWARALPFGALATTDLASVRADRAALGRAAIAAWTEAALQVPC